ncbi:alpha/beta fold hydrolase [Streptomyces hoynatensis]|uniref:Alpha/beta fold hydrolase n=1 Tax=Streptomyces hoynatensis TaxID=1141874 RepID=A0A3A9ZCF1_9ACTN|nr:alpha/beta fold hydrolase [Streptomyces hoynatensis]RKN45845.1 alpha/beta fold hydrolase [Streptomyces hoynatensis]
MPYATAPDGTRIAYQVQGAGFPLVLLAGQANNHHWWDPVRADFDAARRTISLDYRGTGDSGKPDLPYTTRGFAEDVIAVLDHLGIAEADVYGTSMGGRIAQWLAALRPGRVRRLVLGCTTPGGPHSVPRDRELRAALARADEETFRALLLDLMYTPGWLARHPGPYATLGDPLMPPHARRHHLIASHHHDAWDVLPGIKAPTLVVHGTDDRFNPTANAALLAARIPDARALLLPGARHAYFEEFREEASAAVLDFLGAPPRP